MITPLTLSLSLCLPLWQLALIWAIEGDRRAGRREGRKEGMKGVGCPEEPQSQKGGTEFERFVILGILPKRIGVIKASEITC